MAVLRLLTQAAEQPSYLTGEANSCNSLFYFRMHVLLFFPRGWHSTAGRAAKLPGWRSNPPIVTIVNPARGCQLKANATFSLNYRSSTVGKCTEASKHAPCLDTWHVLDSTIASSQAQGPPLV
eukprot:1138300-Pelagomonas_calceolata.AAC.4